VYTLWKGIDFLRNLDSFGFKIAVAMQRKAEPTAGNLDALMERVEKIADHFRLQPLAGYGHRRQEPHATGRRGMDSATDQKVSRLERHEPTYFTRPGAG